MSAATFQNTSTSRGEQAVHDLPRHLQVDGHRLSAFAHDPETKREPDRRFGDIESFPTHCNKPENRLGVAGSGRLRHA